MPKPTAAAVEYRKRTLARLTDGAPHYLNDTFVRDFIQVSVSISRFGYEPECALALTLSLMQDAFNAHFSEAIEQLKRGLPPHVPTDPPTL
jgi:hypothetical protein